MATIRMENGIRRERLRRDLSQKELAGVLSVDNSTISKWESGSLVPDEFKVRIARFFSLPIYELFYFETLRETS